MQMRISHVTRYAYDETVRYSVQALRLTPPSFKGQRVLSWSILAPGIAQASRFKDAFGNEVHLVSGIDLHGDLMCKAEGIVDTEDCAGVVAGLCERAPVRVFLRHTDQTFPDDAIRALGDMARRQNAVDGLHVLMHAVRDAVDYEVGVSGAHTSAAEALAQGSGVCQDHAHIFISAARAIGVPARYVNGYFLSGTEGPVEAHHAWAEAWVDGLGWVGFDPANRMCPTDRYVRLATGLDARSAAPIRGSRRGGTNESLDVKCEVQQANVQQ